MLKHCTETRQPIGGQAAAAAAAAAAMIGQAEAAAAAAAMIGQAEAAAAVKAAAAAAAAAGGYPIKLGQHVEHGQRSLIVNSTDLGLRLGA